MSTYNTSMQYTIGTALSRALDAGHDVEVLVEGQWLSGRVVASDGVGLVLESSETEHSVVRMESINAVRVFAATPHRKRIPAGARLAEERLRDGSMPMPGPRVPVE
jgi:hypothetical protein